MKRRIALFLLTSLILVIISQTVSMAGHHSNNHHNKTDINFALCGERDINICAQRLKELSKNDEVLREEICPYCRTGNFVAIKTQYGVEEYERYEPCSHRPAGVDYIYKTPVYKSYKCSRCGAATNTTSYNYRVECRGLYAK